MLCSSQASVVNPASVTCGSLVLYTVGPAASSPSVLRSIALTGSHGNDFGSAPRDPLRVALSPG